MVLAFSPGRICDGSTTNWSTSGLVEAAAGALMIASVPSSTVRGRP